MGVPKSFSGHQVKRILRISENNPDRANKVLDRMKERKGLAGDTKITKYGIAYKYTPEETARTSVTVGMKEKPKPLASATTPFKHVSLKSDAPMEPKESDKPMMKEQVKPLASGTSASKYVELHSDSKPMESGSSSFKPVELKNDDNDEKETPSKPLSQGQVKRVLRISERNNGSAESSARANRVLDRMRKRNGLDKTKVLKVEEED